MGFGTFSDASCFCVVGSFSAFRIFSHFRWASCSLCELHLRERILHRIVEFRSPLRGALWQPAVQPHFVLAVRRGAAAEFRKACFRLSAECVRRDWKCVYRAELMKYPLSLYKGLFLSRKLGYKRNRMFLTIRARTSKGGDVDKNPRRGRIPTNLKTESALGTYL